MRKRFCKFSHCCSQIGFWHDGDIIFFYHLQEPFSHAINLRASYSSCAGLQIQLSSEPPRFMRGRQPLHRRVRQPVAEELFHRPQHHILYGRTVIASGAHRLVHSPSVAVVHRERNTQFFTVVAAGLEAV